MHRTARIAAVAAVCATLLLAAGCNKPTPATSTAPQKVTLTGASKTSSGTVSVGFNRTVVANGLIVSLRASGRPVNGRYSINLRAENSTDATLNVKVIGNTPQLLDASGQRVTQGVKSGSGFGPGVRPAATAKSGQKPMDAVRTAGLPGHTYAIGAVYTDFDTAGKGYTVRWALSPDRVATIKLP